MYKRQILDLVDGLRDEDLCFLMETKEGYQFKAKPMGDRTLVIGFFSVYKYSSGAADSSLYRVKVY